jgi:hypothetical protein
LDSLNKIINLLTKIINAVDINDNSYILYDYEKNVMNISGESRIISTIKIRPINGEKDQIYGFMNIFDKIGIEYLDLLIRLDDVGNQISDSLYDRDIIYTGTNRCFYIYIFNDKDPFNMTNFQRYDKNIEDNLDNLLKKLEIVEDMDDEAIQLFAKL